MIEVGEYVRTKDGQIYKIEDGTEFYEDSVNVGIGIIPEVDGIWVDKEHFTYIDKRQIVKHSKNIIDLIEDEDIVILEYKTPKYRERTERKFIVCKIDDFINFENRNCNFTYKVGDKKIVDKICKNIKIKGILTTEQFNNEYYRLEE